MDNSVDSDDSQLKKTSLFKFKAFTQRRMSRILKRRNLLRLSSMKSELNLEFQHRLLSVRNLLNLLVFDLSSDLNNS